MKISFFVSVIMHLKPCRILLQWANSCVGVQVHQVEPSLEKVISFDGNRDPNIIFNIIYKICFQ